MLEGNNSQPVEMLLMFLAQGEVLQTVYVGYSPAQVTQS